MDMAYTVPYGKHYRIKVRVR